MPHRRGLALVLFVILLPGCGDGPASGSSGVRGRVEAGPACPVVEEGSPCPSLPFEGTVQVTDPESGEVVAETSTDSRGRFEIQLDPGTYDLLALSGSGAPGGRPSS